jgi:hypothetical protein
MTQRLSARRAAAPIVFAAALISSGATLARDEAAPAGASGGKGEM